MFLELREIGIGEHWFNKNSENMVVVDDVFLEKGIVQVDYTYKDMIIGNPYCTGDLQYFLKEYQRLSWVEEVDNE